LFKENLRGECRNHSQTETLERIIPNGGFVKIKPERVFFATVNVPVKRRPHIRCRGSRAFGKKPKDGGQAFFAQAKNSRQSRGLVPKWLGGHTVTGTTGIRKSDRPFTKKICLSGL